MKYRLIYICTILLLFAGSLSAQNANLARQYYNTGEYEKAAEIYQDLYEKNKSTVYFNYYINALMSMGAYDDVEAALKKELKKSPRPDLYVLYGQLYERQSQEDKATEQYQKAINSLGNDRSSITKLAGAFLKATQYDLAIQTYEKGAQIMKSENIYAYNLAGLYYRKNDIPNMIKQYLLAVEFNPKLSTSVKNVFQRSLDADGLEVLKEALYTRIQERPDEVIYPELLQWVHIQSKDYRAGLRQATALDLRNNENGKRVFDIGQMASGDRMYDEAITAFSYIVEQKPSSPYFLAAKDELMTTKRLKITQNYDYEEEDIRSLEKEYLSFLDEYGYNGNTAYIMGNLAELEALYLNDLPRAIEILEQLTQLKGVEQTNMNQAKLDLGDYYLMSGERWESTLLYSQVDKALKEAYLGELARFKNAKLSYFNGDFEWAQAQFDVLKASTSRLISNDAIDLSVFISDNLGLDTTAIPMEMFAQAELLAYQNKFVEAFSKLDSITVLFPDHGLADDIYYTKAHMYVSLKDYDKAIRYFKKVYENYPDEIRADNSLYALAQIYELYLKQPELAQPLYEKIFIDYSSSTFAVDARKRYRILRGDDI